MTRSISLAAFFVLILGGVFWFTSAKSFGPKTDEDPFPPALGPRVRVVTPEQESGPSKFQFAISTDPSALSQINRETSGVVSRVRPAVVLVQILYTPVPETTSRKKALPVENKTWLAAGVLVGEGKEILTVIPEAINPVSVQVVFQDGVETSAELVGRDPNSKIALLRLPSAVTAKALNWRNRRTLEWGEHLYAMGRSPLHGAQLTRVMVSGDVSTLGDASVHPELHYRQLDQVLAPDFLGAALVDGSGNLAGMVIVTDAPDDLRALVLDGGAVRVVAEALRSQPPAAAPTSP